MTVICSCARNRRDGIHLHTHPFSVGVIDGYASPFGKSQEWKLLAASHSLSPQISLFQCLCPRREPDPFVFCSLFALKSHQGSMQSNELVLTEWKAEGKTGRQREGNRQVDTQGGRLTGRCRGWSRQETMKTRKTS